MYFTFSYFRFRNFFNLRMYFTFHYFRFRNFFNLVRFPNWYEFIISLFVLLNSWYILHRLWLILNWLLGLVLVLWNILYGPVLDWLWGVLQGLLDVLDWLRLVHNLLGHHLLIVSNGTGDVCPKLLFGDMSSNLRSSVRSFSSSRDHQD